MTDNLDHTTATPGLDAGEGVRFLAAIVDSSDDAIFGKTLDGIILSWNGGAERMYGYAPEDVVGKPVWMLGPPERREEFSRIMERLRRGERISHLETVRVRRDRTHFDVSLSISPVFDDSGSIIGAATVARDITQRRLAEQARLQEARVVEVVDRIARALAAELDLRKVAKDIVDATTSLTDAAYGALFHTAGVGETFELLALSATPPAWFASFEAPAAMPRFAPPFTGYESIRTDDVTRDTRFEGGTQQATRPGEGAVRSYLAVPVRSRSGRVLGALFFGHPDTGVFGEREQHIAEAVAGWAAVVMDNATVYEAERAARRDAEAASIAKSNFLAVMSHELRTPLNAILGYTDLWLLGLPVPLPDTLRQQVERVRLSANHLLFMIDEVLTFSRLDAGAEQAHLETVGVARLVEEIGEIVEPVARAKGLGFAMHAHEPPIEIVTDPRRVRQIVLSLLSNAVKFTARGTVDVDVRQEGGDVLVRVEDTGVGIDERDFDRIFDPFWQVEQGTTRVAEGTGIGLAVSRELARLLGGDIRLSSKRGTGSSFTLRLPARLAEPA